MVTIMNQTAIDRRVSMLGSRFEDLFLVLIDFDDAGLATELCGAYRQMLMVEDLREAYTGLQLTFDEALARCVRDFRLAIGYQVGACKGFFTSLSPCHLYSVSELEHILQTIVLGFGLCFFKEVGVEDLQLALMPLRESFPREAAQVLDLLKRKGARESG